MKHIFNYNNFINEGKYEDRTEVYLSNNELSTLDNSFAENEFQTSFNWINKFGGKELLSEKGIRNGYDLLRSLKNGDITIEEIDNVTIGEHGQAGDIPFSETMVAREYIIPHIENLLY